MSNRTQQMQKLIDEAPVMSEKLIAFRLGHSPVKACGGVWPGIAVSPITSASGRDSNGEYTGIRKGIYFKTNDGRKPPQYISIGKIDELGFNVCVHYSGTCLVLL